MRPPIERIPCLLIVSGWLVWCSTLAQFFNHRPFPTYSLEDMPDTSFSCRDKILGGYYADFEAECQMFHICVKVSGVGVQDYRFLCPNGTAFDQDNQICADWQDVDCELATLYYSSDNFDLYRIGSGFESKSRKFGEDEETFALQRAETGDARLNREHQKQRVNQQPVSEPRKTSDREIFRGSSSSNYFSGRNDDYEDHPNLDRPDDVQRRKNKRPNHKRPVSQTPPPPSPQASSRGTTQALQTKAPVPTTHRPNYSNNFAGSSYVPNATTYKPSTTTALTVEQYTTALNKYRQRTNHAVTSNAGAPPAGPAPAPRPRQYNNAENFRQPSTPAPFRPTSSTPYDDGQYRPTTYQPKPGQTENYPANFPHKKPKTSPIIQTPHFDVPRIKAQTSSPKQTPAPLAPTTYKQPSPPTFKQSTPSQFQSTRLQPVSNARPQTPAQPTANYKQSQPSTTYKQTPAPIPTTYKSSTPYKLPQQPQSQSNNYPKKAVTSGQSASPVNPHQFVYPSTFSPRTNIAYSQITQQTTNYKGTTSRPVAVTQYTPTVPKVQPTIPVSVARSNRFDETQYDDGSYRPEPEEFLRAEHSQNIASSRNELLAANRQNAAAAKQHQHQQPARGSNAPVSKDKYEIPRPFSKQPQVTAAVSQPTAKPKPKPAPQKDASYDYAYYDTGVGSEADYAAEIETDIKKSHVRQ